MKSVNGEGVYLFGEGINIFALAVYIHDRRREQISCSANTQCSGYQFNTDSHEISMTSHQKTAVSFIRATAIERDLQMRVTSFSNELNGE